MDPKDQSSNEPDYYVDAGGFIHMDPADAISGSLTFESTSNTGAGCSQSPYNVDSSNDSNNSSDDDDSD